MIVFIESPYAGDIQRNAEYARRAMLHVIGCGCTPIAAHLLYPQVLNDAEPSHRELALVMCKEIREKCDEVWFFVDYGWSDGMKRADRESGEFVISAHIEIGENPPGPSYRKLPLEQQLELERADRKGAHYQLDRAERKIEELRKEVKTLREIRADFPKGDKESEKERHLAIFTPEAIERANAILHPNGRCTCWGEGRCDLCKSWEEELSWNSISMGDAPPDTDRTVVGRLKNGEQIGAFYRKEVWYDLRHRPIEQSDVEAWREPGGAT